MRRPQPSALRRVGIVLVVVAATWVPLTALAARYVPEGDGATSAETAGPRSGSSPSLSPSPRALGDAATPLPSATPRAGSTATERTSPREDDGRPEDASSPERADQPSPGDTARSPSGGDRPSPGTDDRPPPDGSDTRCAVSVLPESGSEQEALEAADERYGGVEVARIFERVPSPWPGRAGRAGRDVIVSLKMKPADVLSGRYDDRLRSWFVNAPRDRRIYWSLHHEPEDNVEDGEFTPARFREAWRHVARLARSSDHPRLYATLILMDWTLDPRSGRDWKDYYVARATDVLAFDVYNHGAGQDPPEYYSAEKQLSTIVETARRAGKPFAIAELGSIRLPNDPDGSGRAAWLTDLTRYLEKHDALWVSYFDIDHDADSDYRLRDEPSIAAWRDFCAR